MLEIEGDSEPSEALLCAVESFSVQAGDGENILSWEEPGVCHDYVIDQIPFYTTEAMKILEIIGLFQVHRGMMLLIN